MTMRRILSLSTAIALVLTASYAQAQDARVYGTQRVYGDGNYASGNYSTTYSPGSTYNAQQPIGNTGTATSYNNYASNTYTAPGSTTYSTQAPQGYAPQGYGTQAPQGYGSYGTQASAGNTAGNTAGTSYGTYGTQAPQGAVGNTAGTSYGTYGTQAPQGGTYGAGASGTTSSYGTYGTQAPQAMGNAPAATGTYGAGANSYGTQAPQMMGNAPAATGAYGTQASVGGAGTAAAPGYYSTQAPQMMYSGASTAAGEMATTTASVGGAGAAASTSSTMASVGGVGARVATSHAAQFIGSDLVWTGLGVLGAGGAAAALIGGNVLGGTTQPSSDCHPTFDCPEYYAQYSLDKMHAKIAYQRGYTGRGTTIALLDTGLDVNGLEFQGRVTSGNGYDYVTNKAGQPASTALSAHGTEVAGVIAANRNDIGMHGVSFDSELLPIRVFDQNNQSVGSFKNAIDYATAQHAYVLNGSYGPDEAYHLLAQSRQQQIITAYDIEEAGAYMRFAAAGGVIVVPTGNSYQIAPDIAVNPTGPGFLPFIKPSNANITDAHSGAYRDESGNVLSSTDFSSLANSMIAVTGVDQNAVISVFANRCGVAKAWCMAAYDENIFTTGLNNTYVTVSGTSFAAPQVAGAVAILHQAFPNLTAQQIRERLFLTAMDLGTPGNDEVYGWGLLDLEKATRPLGASTLSVTGYTNVGPRYDLSNSTMSFGKAFGLGAADTLRQHDVMFLDSQDAAFQMEMGQLTHLYAQKMDVLRTMTEFANPEDRTEMNFGDSVKVGYILEAPNQDSKLIGDGPTDTSSSLNQLRSFSMTDKLSENTEASLHYKDAASLNLGFSESDRTMIENAIAKQGLSNPYAAFASNGYASTFKTEAMGGTVRVAGFFGHDDVDMEARNFGTQAEVGYKLAKDSDAYFSLGSLFEGNRVLGSKGSGAFGFGDSTTTMYTGVGTKLDLGDNIKLHAAGYAGWTDPSLMDNSLINSASTIISSSFNMGIERKGVGQDDDTLSFNFSQPLRAESGNMSFILPYARSVTTNDIYSDYITQGLAPTGRELDMEVNYAMPLGLGESVTTAALFRKDAGHQQGVNDALGLVRWMKKF